MMMASRGQKGQLVLCIHISTVSCEWKQVASASKKKNNIIK